jgi:hypothetical protein
VTQEAHLSVAASPAQAEAVAKFVRELGAGFITVGEGTKFRVKMPLRFAFEPRPYGFRLIPDERIAVEREGVDPWLEYLDLYFDGTIRAGLRLVFAFEKEV